MTRVVVLGAGLAGLSAGYHAKRVGLDPLLFESAPVHGGLCRSYAVDGFTFDLSGHLLHLKDPSVGTLVRDLLGPNIREVERDAVISSHSAFVPYPFQANLHGLPEAVVRECVEAFEAVASSPRRNDPPRSFPSFESWVLATLGEGIARHFMFPYNAKLWTVPPSDLSCDWLGDFVPLPTVDEVRAGAAGFGPKRFGYNATFLYPEAGGIGVLTDALARDAGEIRLDRRAVDVDPAHRTVSFDTGETEKYDRLVSTIPLPELIRIVRDAPAEVSAAASALRHASVTVVNLGIGGAARTRHHWIYLPEERFQAYRVGVYSNIAPSMAPDGFHSFYVETAYRGASQGKTSEAAEESVANAIADLTKLGFIDGPADVVVSDVVDIPHAYVIHDAAWRKARTIVLGWLDSVGIRSIGRYGAWEYSSMEEALRQGRDALVAGF